MQWIAMPIEIKELHIRVAVNTAQSAQSPGGQMAVGNDSVSGGNVGDAEAIVAECVEQVLQVLQNKMER
jgi:hypothetical protein